MNVNNQELRCFELFQRLNAKYQYFKDVYHTNAGCRHDVNCTFQGKPVTVELKERFKMYDTLFIRVDKVFYKDKTYIFNLKKVKPLRKTSLKVWNPALNSHREELNYELSVNDAIIK